jgi:hypothetical protein
LLAKWRPGKHKCLHIIAALLDRNLWIRQSRASFVQCSKLLKAIKVVENMLKAFESNDVLPNDELSCERHLLGRW